MLRCKELSRLPKAASGKYVNFRRQTPGCTANHFKPGSTPLSDCLDPSHPAARLSKNYFPSIRSDVLGIKAVPFATLSIPEQVWTTPSNIRFDTWTERVQRLLNTNSDLKEGEERLKVAPILLNNAKENAIPMSFINATSKKRTSNKKIIRVKIVSRLKVAINLIVSRGADVTKVNGKPKIFMDEKEAEKMSDKWVSPGWTYIFFPTLEIYRMPYHEIIPMLRESLRRIYDLSQDFERKWVSSATTQRKVPPQSSYSTRIPSQTGKFNSRKPFQNRGPTKTTYRAYSTRPHPTTYSDSKSANGKFDTKSSRKCNRNVLKTPNGCQLKSPEHLSQSRRSIKLNKTPIQVPKSQKTIPKSKTSTPKSKTSIPKSKTSTPKSKTSIPKSKKSIPKSKKSIPKSKKSIPKSNKSIITHKRKFDAIDKPGVIRTVRLGDVVFPIYNSPIPDNDCSKIVPAIREDDSSMIVLKHVRDDATLLLRKSREFHASKLKRKSVRRRITLEEAQRREPLGLEFIGFDSQPDPSYDPFTDLERSPKPNESPTLARKALLDLLDTTATTSDDKSPNGSSPSGDDFALLEPTYTHSAPGNEPEVNLTSLNVPPETRRLEDLIQTFDPFQSESEYKSPNDHSSPLDVDDFAPLEPTYTPFVPEPVSEVDLPSLNVPPAETKRLEDLIQAFDPFQSEESDGPLIEATTSPVSQSTSGSGTLSTLTRGSVERERAPGRPP